MLVQVALLGEAHDKALLLAVRALERLLSGVDAQVIVEIMPLTVVLGTP